MNSLGALLQNFENQILASSCLSLRPERMEQAGSHWKDFDEI